jgi:DNA polymerase-1
MKRAMLEVASQLRRRGLAARMLLQVHDELVFEARQEALGALVELVRSVMEQALPLSVPLTVTVKTGPNWLELVET